jgi:hypothetical protein
MINCLVHKNKKIIIISTGSNFVLDLFVTERMKGALVTGGTVLAVGGVLGVLSSTSLLGFGCRAIAQLAPLAFTLARRR